MLWRSPRRAQARPSCAVAWRCAELPRGESFREATLKMLTGGEPMLVRHLNQGFFEMRPTIGAPLYAGAEESTSGGWLRFADAQALDAPALAMLADAWWPSPMPRLTRPAAAPTIDLTVHFRAPATAVAIVEEPVLAVFGSSTAAGGFFEEDGELWSADGVLLAHSRQLGLLVDGGR